MGTYLYRLGKASFAHRRLVLLLWLLLVGLSIIGAGLLSRPTSDSLSIPGIESQSAIDILARNYPGAQGLAELRRASSSWHLPEPW